MSLRVYVDRKISKSDAMFMHDSRMASHVL